MDRHKEVANELIELIYWRNPRASIGLAGSVASDTYTLQSDIDILVCSEEVESGYLVSFLYHELKVSIFVYSVSAYCQCKWEYLYRHMPSSYIIGVRSCYDAQKYIHTLRFLIQENIQRGNKNRELLMIRTKEQIYYRFKQLYIETDEIQRKYVYYTICANICRLLYLRFFGFRIMTKIEQRNPLVWMKQIDEELCRRYRTVMLYDADHFLKIEELFNFININD